MLVFASTLRSLNVYLLFYPVCSDIQKGIALFEGSRALPTLPSEKGSIKMMMVTSVEGLWNDTGSGKQILDKNPVLCRLGLVRN